MSESRGAAHNFLLVVHDDPEAAARIAGHFHQNGYDVDCASTFADAEALLLTCRYDALVTSLDLSDGSGLDLLPLCPRWFGCRAVIVSPKQDPKTDANALMMGAIAVIAEPLDLWALRDCLSDEPRDAVSCERDGSVRTDDGEHAGL